MKKNKGKNPCTSLFDGKERRVQKELERKVTLINEKISSIPSISPEIVENASQSIEKLLHSYENQVISSEIWIFISIDSFQTSIEERDNPDLCSKPFAISSNSLIQSFNSLAASFSLKPSMPEFQALSLCKDLEILIENPLKYKTESLKLKEIFTTYDPSFEETGLDEAALFVTTFLKRKCMDTDTGREALAQEIRRKIWNDLKLPSSAGVACNKTLAKIACQVNRPNRQFYLRPENSRKFMKNLWIRDNPCFTKNDGKLLEMLEFKTCGHLVERSLEVFFGFNEIALKKYLKIALGVGEFNHFKPKKEKGCLAASKSFEPLDQEEVLEEKLREMADGLEFELKKNKVKGKGIEISLKNVKYETKIRREEAKHYFLDGKGLFDLAVTLLRMFYPVQPIRGITLKVWKLKEIKEEFSKELAMKGRIRNDNEFQKMFLYHSIVPNNAVPVESDGKKKKKGNSYECSVCKQWFNGRETDAKTHKKYCQGQRNYFKSLSE
jgi:nucleotidyltransferase/DNA polymerase involved in DNA repair